MASKRFLRRNHFVHNGPKGKDVGAGRDLTALQLLRSHIREGAENGAGSADGIRWKFGEECQPTRILPQFRQAEVEELRTRTRQHDVAGLQVTVCYAFRMGLIQSVGNFGGIPQNLIQRQRPSLEPFSQRLAFQIFHDEEIRIVLMADVMKRADMWMVKSGNGARLPYEPLAQFRAVGEVCSQ